MGKFRQFMAIAAVATLAVLGLGAAPASAAMVITKACDGGPFYYPNVDATMKVCVQYNGTQINGVADVVTGAGALTIGVEVWQCNANLCGELLPPASQNVPAHTHQFVATTLYPAARGHSYVALLLVNGGVVSSTDPLAVPCPC